MKDIRKSYIYSKSMNPHIVKVSNQTSETRGTRITGTAHIIIQDHTVTTISIPTNPSSGWTSVLLAKTHLKQLEKVFTVHPESKVRNYLICHAQLIHCAPNPPNCSQIQNLTGASMSLRNQPYKSSPRRRFDLKNQ
jgi:hypothetical protein